MRQFYGEIITGPQNGHIAVVTNGDKAYEIHPLGDVRHREFYARHAAVGLADNHAAFLNSGKEPTSSFIRRL